MASRSLGSSLTIRRQSPEAQVRRATKGFLMRRLGFLLIAGLVTGLAGDAASQPLPNAKEPPAQPSSPGLELPKAYIPGLGEFMGRIQVDHAKLWLSAEARNWELAEYELGEMKEVFSDVQDLVPRYQNVPVGDMIDAIITGAITDLEGAVKDRDFARFSTAFDGLTGACNSCHQAANRPYIAIRRPAQSNFSNQDFSPPAAGK
jgi:hypothetical protein